MISLLESHWVFKQEFNKLDSNVYRDLNDAEIDMLFNKAQLLEIAEKVRYKEQNGFEVDTKIMKELSHLVVRSNPNVIPTFANNLYEVKLYNPTLLFDCLRPVYFQVTATKNNCTKSFNVLVREHDDIAYQKFGSTQKSSFKWNRVLGYLARSSSGNTLVNATQFYSNSLYIDTNGEFVINSVYPVYLKYPRQICLGTYSDITAPPLSPNKPLVEWEHPEEVVREIISRSVELAAFGIESPNAQAKTYIEKLSH